MFSFIYGRDGEHITSEDSYESEVVSAIFDAPALHDRIQF